MAQIRQHMRSPYPIIIEEIDGDGKDATGTVTNDVLRILDKAGNKLFSVDKFGTIGGIPSGSLAATESRTPPYTVYLDQLLGNDSNSGNSPGTAVLTIAKAISLLQQAGHGGKVKLVTGLGAGNLDIAAPISIVYPISIETLSTMANTIRRTFGTPNGRSVWDAITTVGGSSLQSATAAFVAGDVNRIVSIYGAGVGGGTYYDFISAVPDGTHATLTATTTIARNATTDPKGVKASIVGDWNRVVTDASMTAGSADITSVNAAWTKDDIGTEVIIAGAGQGQALRTAIKSFVGNVATGTAIASNTVSGQRCAIRVNFGDLFTWHVGQSSLQRIVLTDQTSGNNSIGAAIKILSDDLGAGVVSSPSDLSFDDVIITSTDTSGSWEHTIDGDGSWNQVSSGPGVRRVIFRGLRPFGTRRPTENIRLNSCVHWNFVGSVGMVGSPTSIAQGIMILDPQMTGISVRGTADIHFAAFEGYYYYAEGQYCTYHGGRLLTQTAVAGRNVIELGPTADHCSVITVNGAIGNTLEIDQGTNNVIRTTTIKDTREHSIRGGTVTVWRESYDHRYAAATLTPTSGTLIGAPIEVLAAESVGHVLLQTFGTAATFGSNNDGHWYVAIYDDANNLVAQTADQGVTAIPSFSAIQIVLPTIKPIKDINYQVAIMIYLGTGGAPVMPTLKASSPTIAGIAVTGMPRACFVANAGLTTGVAPATLTITGSAASIPYAMLYT